MEKTRKSLSARLEKLNDTSRKDNVVTFEQLGVDQMKMDRYLQMPREELIALIRNNFSNYRPKPAR